MKGRILWETAFFGLVSALGLAALLVAMVLGALVAAGVSDFSETASTFLDHLTAGGGAIAIPILGISYLTGGYVAGRMARSGGWRQGLGVWLLSVVLLAAGALAAWIAGGTLDPTKSISLPDNPIDTGPLQDGWLLVAVCVLLSLLASVTGGFLGEGYQRSLDRDEQPGPPVDPEPEPEPEERKPEEAESETEAEPTEVVPA